MLKYKLIDFSDFINHKVVKIEYKGMKMTNNNEKMVKVIEKTQEFLKTHKWVRGKEAVNKKGNIVLPKSKGACAWCVRGALVKCSNESVANEINNEYNAYKGYYLEAFNDDQARDKREVVRELQKLKKFIMFQEEE